jgi:murein DD-endopeptidase MepM/ murein hydrolase activator NlpD
LYQLFFSGLAVADPGQGEVRLQAPSSVVRGEGFVCRFMPVPGGSSYTLEWLDKNLDLAVARPGTIQEVLLGVGIKRMARPELLRLSYVAGGKKKVVQCAVNVRDKNYPEQRLILPPSMANLSPKNLARYYREKKVITHVLARQTAGRFWSLPLTRPVPGSVSSAYGLTRFINNQPRAPHRGVDFRGSMGVPIKACADGIVDLVADHYFSGRSVYLDHGQGVTSVYFHMSKIQVKEGQVVHKGQVVGTMGRTGRATGPHLHFGLYVLGEPINPMPFMDGAFKTSDVPAVSVRK